MKKNIFELKSAASGRCFRTSYFLPLTCYFLVLTSYFLPLTSFAAYPSWWTNRSVVNISAGTTNDYSAANAGQLKWFAVKACEELNANLPGGAGSNVQALVASFTPSNNYAAVNAGQLKSIAKPFYDRLIAAGVTNAYPWTATVTDDVSYAVVNIGQVKNIFNFTLPAGATNSSYKMNIALTGYNRSEALTNFPVLVVFSNNMAAGFAYSQFASTNGFDLRFRNAAETLELNYEVESWNPAGASYVWVQVPLLTNNTGIVASWGDPSLAAAPAVYSTNGAAWTQGYRGVWHMKETVGTTLSDSTLRNHPGTRTNGVTLGVTGRVDKAVSFGGGNSERIYAASHADFDSVVFTVSCWVKSAGGWATNGGTTTETSALLSRHDTGSTNGFFIYMRTNGTAGIQAKDGSVVRVSADINRNLLDNNWHLISAVFNRGSGGVNRVYSDGILESNTVSTAAWAFNNQPLWFGSSIDPWWEEWKGSMDEVRLSTGERSANWIWASWLNMASNSAFNACGTVTSVTISNVAPSITAQPTNVTVTAGQTAAFSVSATGTAPLSYQWRRNAANISGATNTSYTTPATTNGDNGAQFNVVVQNVAGSVTSAVAILTVNSGAVKPSITAQPTNVTVTAGQTAAFSVSATGTAPLSYQWRRNAVNISGATNTSYTTPATTNGDNGAQFNVVVQNVAGSATSAVATLTVTATNVIKTLIWDGLGNGNWTDARWQTNSPLYPGATENALIRTNNRVAVAGSQLVNTLYLEKNAEVQLGTNACVNAYSISLSNSTLSMLSGGCLQSQNTNMTAGKCAYEMTAGTNFASLAGTNVVYRKSGTGFMLDLGNNTYSGRAQLDAGILAVSGNAASIPAASVLFLNSGMLGTTGTITRTLGNVPGGVYFNTNSGFFGNGGPLTLNFGSGSIVDWSSTNGFNGKTLILGSAMGTGPVEFRNNIALRTNATVQVDDNTNSLSDYARFSGSVSNGDATARGLTKAGSGRLELTGTNSYTGGTILSGGQLYALEGTGLPTNSLLQLNSGIYESAGTLTRTILNANGRNLYWNANGGFAAVGAPLTVQLNGGATIDWSSTNGFNAKTLVMGSVRADNVVVMPNSVNLKGWRTIQVDDNTNSLADRVCLSGVIANGTTTNCALVKTGTGLLELTGTNTMIGTNVLSAGILRAAEGVGLSTNSLLQFNGGILESSGVFARSTANAQGRNVSWLAAGGFAAYGAPLNIALNGGQTLDWSALTNGFNAKTLILGSANANNVVQMLNAIDLKTNCTVQVNDNTNSISDYAVFAGALNNGDATARSLTKTGSGMLELTAANTFSGGLTVSAGELRLNGSLLTSAATVNGTETRFGGLGTVRGITVNAGAVLAPGNGSNGGVGTLASVTNVTVAANGVYEWQLGSNSCDSVTVTGNVYLTSGWKLRFKDAGGMASGTNQYTLFKYTGTAGVSACTFDFSQVSTSEWGMAGCSIVNDAAGKRVYLTGLRVRDLDADGLPDAWEVARFGNAASQCDSDDSDGDGLNNISEYLLGTNPTNRDTDADGYLDGVEVRFGSSPTDAASIPRLAVSGVVQDTSFQSGGVTYVYAVTNAAAFSLVASDNHSPYAITNLPALKDYWIKSFRDVNANGTQESWEPAGVYAANPLYGAGSLTNINIVLTDPDVDGDGLPDAWELTYFGNTNSQYGTGDYDSDGLNNAGEYQAGRNPTQGDCNLRLSATGNNAIFTVSTNGWYASNSVVTVQAVPYGMYGYFAGWTGQTIGINTNANPVTITNTQSRTLVAQFVSLTNGLSAYYSFNTPFAPSGPYYDNRAFIPNELGGAGHARSYVSSTNSGKAGGSVNGTANYPGGAAYGITFFPDYQDTDDSYAIQFGGRTVCFWAIVDSNAVGYLFSPMDLVYDGAGKLCHQTATPMVPQVFTSNRWHFIAATCEGTPYFLTNNLYIDGVRCTDNMNVAGSYQSKLVSIGVRELSYSVFQNPWPGRIDEFMVFDRILNSNDVQRLYTRTVTNFASVTAFNGPAPTNQTAGTRLEVSTGSYINWYEDLANGVVRPVMSNSTVKLCVTNDFVPVAGTRQLLGGYTGTGSIPSGSSNCVVVSNINAASSITWQWQTNYWMDFVATGGGRVVPPSGWFGYKAPVSVSAIATGSLNFVRWTGAIPSLSCQYLSSITVTADSPKTVTGNFSQTSGWLIVRSQYGTPEPPVGTNVYNYGALLVTNTQMILSGGSTQYLNVGWAGSGSVPVTGSSNSFSCNLAASPSMCIWQWVTNYLVTTNITPAGAGSVSNNIGWYRHGASVTVTAVQTSSSLFTNWSATGVVLAGMSTNNPLTFTVTNAVALTAMFATNGPLVVTATRGSPTPPVGTTTYNYGTVVNASMPTSVVAGTQFVSLGWTGTGSVPASGSSNSFSFTMSRPSTCAWQKWATNYFVTAGTSYYQDYTNDIHAGGGVISNNAGLYALGAGATITAIPSNSFMFMYWSATGTPLSAVARTNAVLNFTVTNAVALTAVFAADDDGDGMPSAWEVSNGLNKNDPSDAVQDADYDGLTNLREFRYGTNPGRTDTDNDKVSDYQAFVRGLVSSNSVVSTNGVPDTWKIYWFGSTTNANAADSADPDADGLVNKYEFAYGSNPTLADSDGDSLNDGTEVNTWHTSPSLVDSDGDGLSDTYEMLTAHTSPLVADSDADGLQDGDEVLVYGTDSLNQDSDNDGLTDGDEVNRYATDPRNPDTDGDGMNDGWEVLNGLDPLDSADASGPGACGLSNLQVYQAGFDSDGDGLVNGSTNALYVVPLSNYVSRWLPRTVSFAYANLAEDGWFCIRESGTNTAVSADWDGNLISDAMDIYAGGTGMATNSYTFYTNKFAVVKVKVGPAPSGAQWGVHMWSTNFYDNVCVTQPVFTVASSSATASNSAYACVPLGQKVSFTMAYTNNSQYANNMPYGIAFERPSDGGAFPWIVDPASAPFSGTYTQQLPVWTFICPSVQLIAANNGAVKLYSRIEDLAPLDMLVAPASLATGVLKLESSANGGKINICTGSDGSGVLTLPASWTNNAPTRLWVKGTNTSASLNDIELKLTYTNSLSSTNWQATAKLTVYNFGIDTARTHKYVLAGLPGGEGLAQIGLAVSPAGMTGAVTVSVGGSPVPVDPATVTGTVSCAVTADCSYVEGGGPLDLAVSWNGMLAVASNQLSVVSNSYVTAPTLLTYASMTNRFDALFTNITVTAAIYPAAISGLATSSLDINTSSITNGNSTWVWSSSATLSEIDKTNSYSAKWILPYDLNRQLKCTTGPKRIFDAYTNGSPAFQCYITLTHDEHWHEDGDAISSVSYPTCELTLNSEPAVNPNTLFWSITPATFGTLSPASGKGATVTNSWNTACEGAVTFRVTNTVGTVDKTLSVRIVNNPLQIATNRFVLTNSPDVFLPLSKALSNINDAAWSVLPAGTDLLKPAMTGCFFAVTNAAPGVYTVTVANTYCSSSSGSSATVNVCRVNLDIPGIAETNEYMPGAVMLMNSNLTALSLSIEPRSINTGTLQLSMPYGATNVTVWTNAARQGAAVTLPANWPASAYPRTLYAEGKCASTNARDIVWQLSYTNGSFADTDKVAATVFNANINAFKTDKTNAISGVCKVSPGLYVAEDANDSNGDKVRDNKTNTLCSLSDTNDMALLVFKQMPGITNFQAVSNIVLSVTSSNGGTIRLFAEGCASGTPARVSNVGDSIPAITNITSSISTSDVRMLVQGVTGGRVEVQLMVLASNQLVLARDTVAVNVLPIPADTDSDDVAVHSGGSMTCPVSTETDIGSLLNRSTFLLGFVSTNKGISASAYLSSWHVAGVDERTLRQNTYSLDTKILGTEGSTVRLLRPNGRVVSFDSNGFPVMPDNARSYRLITGGVPSGCSYGLVFASGYKHYFATADGRLALVEDPDGAQFSAWPVSTSVSGRVTSVTSSYGTSSVSYDALARVAGVTNTTCDAAVNVSYTNAVTELSTLHSGVKRHYTSVNQDALQIIRSTGPGVLDYVVETARLVSGDGVSSVTFTNETPGAPAAGRLYVFNTFDWGKSLTNSTVYGSNPGLDSGTFIALSTKYYYETNSALPAYGRVTQEIGPDGSWARYGFDANRLLTNTVSGFKDAPAPLPGSAAVTSSNRTVCYSYSTLSAGDANRPADYNRPRQVSSFVLGTLVGRRYSVYGNASNETQVAVTPSAVFGDPANLRTIVLYNTGALAGWPSQITSPDNSVARLDTVQAGGDVVVTSYIANDPLNAVTKTYIDGRGRTYRTEDGYTNGVMMILPVTNSVQFNNLNQVTNKIYTDGRKDVFAYSPCGICTNSVDREGVTNSVPGVDWFGRATNVLNSGVTTETSGFDCFGNAQLSRTYGVGTETQTVTAVFDGTGRLLSSTDPRGTVSTSTFNILPSKVGTVTLSTKGNRQWSKEFFADGETKGIYGVSEYPELYDYGVTNGSQTFMSTYRYAGAPPTNGLLDFATAGTAQVWTAVMDMLGRTVTQINGDGSKSAIFYDKAGNVVMTSNEWKLVTLTEFDVAGRKTFETTDLNGNGIRDAGDAVTVYSNRFTQYNGVNVLETSIFEVTSDNSLRTITKTLSRLDGLGGWSFDPTGMVRSTSVTYVNGSQRKVTTTFPDLKTTESVHVGGELRSMKNRQDVATTYDRDGFNRMTRSDDAGPGTTVYNYGPNDTSISVTSADGNQSTTTYDAFREVASQQDNAGNSVTNEYYSTGDLKAKWGAAATPVTYTYDGVGNRKSQAQYRNWAASPASGGFAGRPDVTSWERDPVRGWVTAKIYPDGKRHELRHAPDGLVTNMQDARGVQVWLDLNPLGEILVKKYGDGTPCVTNVFDCTGLKTNVTDASGSRTMWYDARRHPVLIVSTNGRVNYSLSYSYVPETGSRSNMTFTLGSMVTKFDYSYDSWGRLAGVKPSFTNSGFTYVYVTNTDYLAAVRYPNGAGVGYVYPTNSFRLASLINSNAAGSVISRFDYTYNKVDQCTNVARLYESRNVSYTYDSYRQLVGTVTKAYGIYTTNEWLCDSAGNRLSDSAGSNGTERGYTTTNLNQLLAVTSVTGGNTGVARFGYDANGNTTNQGSTFYTWDAENRLTGMSNAAQRAVYRYDSEGRRVYKRVDNWIGSSWQLSTENDFIYDGWLLLGEVINNGAGVVTNVYCWGIDKSGSVAGCGGVGGLLARCSVAGGSTNLSFYLSDKQGNIMTMLDAGGTNITASYEYSPFGELVSATGSAASNNTFRFSTKYWDAELGMFYYGYRYYSPVYGRWWSRDPLQEEGGNNLYEFVWNDPMDHVDALGLTGAADLQAVKECAIGYKLAVYRAAACLRNLTESEASDGALLDQAAGVLRMHECYIKTVKEANGMVADVASAWFRTPAEDKAMQEVLELQSMLPGFKVTKAELKDLGISYDAVSGQLEASDMRAGGVELSLQVGEKAGECAGWVTFGAGAVRMAAKEGIKVAANHTVRQLAKMAATQKAVGFTLGKMEPLLAEYNISPEHVQTGLMIFQCLQMTHNLRCMMKGGPNCFEEGTPVSTPEGLVRIEEIRPGDTVLSFDRARGVVTERVVLETYTNIATYMVDVVAGGEVISATPEHRFWIADANVWVEAMDVRSGMQLRLAADRLVVVDEVRNVRLATPRKTYNLNVAVDHAYFVGEGRILVHNDCTAKPDKAAPEAGAKSTGQAVIEETLAGKGNITSKITLTADEALSAGEKFVGPGYREIGKTGSGVFQSSDDLFRFRMDNNSLLGNHAPDVPHVHFEVLPSPNAPKPIVNNHVPFVD